MLALAVAVAAGVGAVARYVLDQLVERRTGGAFPYGTLLVNLSGSFLLGLLTGLALHHGFPRAATAVLAVGFAGGYTTFSTWAWESVELHREGAVATAAANTLGSFAVGLAVAAVGLALAAV